MRRVYATSLIVLAFLFYCPTQTEVLYAFSFTDVSENTPYKQAIEYLANKKIIHGYADGTFRSEQYLNRAEILTLLIRSRYREEDYYGYESCFPDVSEEWFSGPVCFAKQRGLVSGYEDGLFHPGSFVNKAEGLKMMLKAMHIDTALEQPEFFFEDVGLSTWFADEVSFAKRYGLIDESFDKFYPQNFLSRGYFSEIFYRALQDRFVSLLKRKDVILVLVDEDTFLAHKDALARFVSDIEAGSGKVIMQYAFFPSKESVRVLLQDFYRNKGLTGAIFVGEIPEVYFGSAKDNAFVSDWYYQDLDNTLFKEVDGMIDTSFYSSLNPITDREIWTSRIKPPISGSSGRELLNNYFNRHHQFAAGSSSYIQKMLLVDSVSSYVSGQTNNLTEAIGSLVNKDYGLYASRSKLDIITGADLDYLKEVFLQRLGDPYEFSFVNMQGGVSSNWLGEDVIIRSSEVRSHHPMGLFYFLQSSSAGDFSRDDYMAGWYLFGGKALVVSAQSAASGSYHQTLLPTSLFGLAGGASIGEGVKNQGDFLLTQLFGDATIHLRPELSEGSRHGPDLMVKKLSIDFGSSELDKDTIVPLFFKNGGTQRLYISLKPIGALVDSSPINSDIQPFSVHLDSGDMADERAGWFEIEPGQVMQLPMAFDPSQAGLPGVYEGRMILYTNDADVPYARVYLRGRAI